MKAYSLFFILWIIVSACSQRNKPGINNPGTESGNQEGYDSLLAVKLGADEYGMKTYVMVFLRVGLTPPVDSLEKAGLQHTHPENIKKLAEEGKLVLAGPFLDSDPVRGIYLFDVPTLEEAKALAATDPAVAAGSLIMELHPWYGSAALTEVNKISRKITRKSI